MNFTKRSRRIKKEPSPVQLLLIFYFLAIIGSTAILSLPVAYKPGVSIPFIDVLFTAVSALSVTGLSTVDLSETFSTTGIVMIALILQLGAVGVMAIGTFLWLLLGKKIGIKERQLIKTDQNQPTFSGMVRLIKQIILLLLTIEIIAILLLGAYFIKDFPTVKEAYFQSFFMVLSAVSNGGFDITGESLLFFQTDYFVLWINMTLIVIGAIGFPVLIEIKDYLLLPRKKRQLFRFSLFTKVTTATFFLLVVIGTGMTYLLDMGSFFSGKSFKETFHLSLFQSVTTRSGGLSTVNLNDLTEQNHMFMAFLMFIGASPSSAGGGIRTTTFALVLMFIITYARGRKNIRIFNREVYEDDLMKAITVTLMALILIFSAVFMISIFEEAPLLAILFEVTSAFGTVGLSLGITETLSTGSKIILMLLMFIGRVGVITFLFMFKNTTYRGKYHYPKERLIIG